MVPTVHVFVSVVMHLGAVVEIMGVRVAVRVLSVRMLVPVSMLMLVRVSVLVPMFVTVLVLVLMSVRVAVPAIVIVMLVLILLVRVDCAAMDSELDPLDALSLLAVEVHVKVADIELREFPLERRRFHAEIDERADGHVAGDTGEAIEEEDFHVEEGGGGKRSVVRRAERAVTIFFGAKRAGHFRSRSCTAPS
jgi:hypothetical protein